VRRRENVSFLPLKTHFSRRVVASREEEKEETTFFPHSVFMCFRCVSRKFPWRGEGGGEGAGPEAIYNLCLILKIML
jgi:hypothetical protein